MALRIAAALLAALLAATPATAEPPAGTVQTVMADAIGDHVRPSHAAFDTATGNLAASVDALCTAPGEANLAAAREAFRAAALTWAGIEFVRFGPVMSQNRLERVLFWPDRKGIGLKQVQAALAGSDPSATDPETLQGKSVALQGLGALEFALFGTGSESLAGEPGYRCRFALAISRNLAAIAGELVAGWADPAGVAAYWTGERDAAGATQTLNQLIGTLVHGLEAIRDTRLRPFLDLEDDRDNPRAGLFWRSDMTLPMIAADIDGLKDLFDHAGMARLLPDGAGSIAGNIDFEFRQALGLLRPDARPLAEVLKDKAARDRLILLDLLLGSLIGRLDREFAQAAGLASGFSFADGD